MPNVRVILTPNGGSPVELPLHFRYRLPNLQKKMSVRKTCNGAVIQESDACHVVNGELIPWTMNGSCPTEYKAMYDLYSACDEGGGSVIYTFEGYWGESYEVIFSELDDDGKQGRVFDMSGSFTILCVNTEPNPENSLY